MLSPTELLLMTCDESEKELKTEMFEDVGMKPLAEQVKDEAEECADQKVDDDDESDEDVLETTPQMSDASVIKYSVKTTPYLQR